MVKFGFVHSTHREKSIYTGKMDCCYGTVSKSGIKLEIPGGLYLSEKGKSEIDKKMREIKKILMENIEN